MTGAVQRNSAGITGYARSIQENKTESQSQLKECSKWEMN
jgi:hypothetical protein